MGMAETVTLFAITPETRNPGIALDLDAIASVRVNRAAVDRRIASLAGRRTVKKAWQAAWLLKAVSCLDLTTLSGDATPGRVRRLCANARQPLRSGGSGRAGD